MTGEPPRLSSSRLRARDTEADQYLSTLLSGECRQSFSVVAGAGSGKTTSLVKAVASVLETHGEKLIAHGQRLACITYTEVAAREIQEEVGDLPILDVGTIHHFFWNLISPFPVDVASWAYEKTMLGLAEQESALNKRRGKIDSQEYEVLTGQLEERRQSAEQILGVTSWRYGFGNRFERGVIGHAGVFEAGPYLVLKHRLLAKLAGRAFPFIFVDESQDTSRAAMKALDAIAAEGEGSVSVGLFGDPAQHVFFQGGGQAALASRWEILPKPQNYRSSNRILQLANRIRSDIDGMSQIAGHDGGQMVGEAHFFVFSDVDNRDDRINQVLSWLGINGQSGSWLEDDGQTRVLLLTHEQAAKRHHFGNVLEAIRLDDGLKSAFGDERRGPWLLQPFELLSPLVAASERGDGEDVMRLLGPSLEVMAGGGAPNVRQSLKFMSESLDLIRKEFRTGGPGSVGRVLNAAFSSGILPADRRLAPFFGIEVRDRVQLRESEKAAVESFVECDVAEVERCTEYREGRGRFVNMEGVKGREFQRVAVVLDDREGASYTRYSFGKLLGTKPLSTKDIANQEIGADDVVARTRRLLYVCVTRAIKAVAIVVFADSVEDAAAAVVEQGLALTEPVLLAADLDVPTVPEAGQLRLL